MNIAYKIPSGVMRINADEFFKLARRSAVRRMFRQLSQDHEAEEEYAPMIRQHLQTQEQEEQLKRAYLLNEQAAADIRLREVRTRYQEMKNPCCACYTKDKDVLKAAGDIVQAAKVEISRIKYGIAEAQRMEQRYKEIQEDVTKILGGK